MFEYMNDQINCSLILCTRGYKLISWEMSCFVWLIGGLGLFLFKVISIAKILKARKYFVRFFFT